jgi:hypothetical protein
LGFRDITALRTIFSTAGIIVIIPYMSSQWGCVLALILIASRMLLLYGIAAFIYDIVIASPNIRHHGDVCYTLGG